MSGIEIIIGLVAGIIIGILINKRVHKKTMRASKAALNEMKNAAKLESEKMISEARLASKEEMIRVREELEQGNKEIREELSKKAQGIQEREEKLDQKMDQLQERLDNISERDQQVNDMMLKLDADKEKLRRQFEDGLDELSRISELNRDDAEKLLLEKLDSELAVEKGAFIRRSIDERKSACEKEAQKILVQVMQRLASDCAYDRTTSTVPLPSDEMKGRIIGREGRNIRVFEAATGVNILIDDTPSAVVVSCFDPVRREVARIALERLVEDGRIHPTRVEEIVAKARMDVNNLITQAGEDALHQLQISNIPPPVVDMLGRLRFRYSFSQNVLTHSIEVANLMSMVASELGLDSQKAKRMGLFHDIGKAMDHEKEGSHAIIGMEFLKRHGEDPEVLNGVGCHHNEIPPESPLAAMVSVCDAISASRPGSRSETTEIYLKRLEQLEEIGYSFKGVESCYAVQAGREIRVFVEPDSISESEAYNLSRDIALEVEKKMQYPGQIKVCVIRETRSVEFAK